MSQTRANKNLYYFEKGSEANYSFTPQGEIDVSRLIRGAPYWRQAQESEQAKNKKLILADWTAPTWQCWTAAIILEKIKQLLTEGFEIYVWQNGDFLSISARNLNKLNEEDIRKLITYSSSEEIASKFSRDYQVSKEKLHVLSEGWIKEVGIDEDIETGFHVRRNGSSVLIDTSLLQSTLYQQGDMKLVSEYIGLLKTKEYDRVLFAVDSLSEESLKFSNELKEALQKANINVPFISNAFKKIVIKNQDQLESINGEIVIKMADRSFKVNRLHKPYISKIVLNIKEIDEKILQGILENTSLKCLELNGKKIPVKVLENINLSNLHEIKLANMSLSPNDLTSILNKTGNHASLTLDNFILKDGEFDSTVRCQKITSLSMRNTLIMRKYAETPKGEKQLNMLLNIFPNLKHLYLGINLYLNKNQIKLNEMNHLESVELSYLEISENNLQEILIKSKMLKNIVVRDDKRKQIDADFNVDLEDLEVADFSRSHFSDQDIASILNGANKIKELNLPNLKKNQPISTIFKENNMASLEKLTIHFGIINTEAINRLFIESSNIKEITIDRCEFKDIEDMPEFGNTSISKISIFPWDHADDEFSKKLLHRLKGLEAINYAFDVRFEIKNQSLKIHYLGHFIKGNYIDILPENLLNKVRQILIDDRYVTNLSIDWLANFLTYYPSLKLLDLSCCPVLSNKIEIQTFLRVQGVDVIFFEKPEIDSTPLLTEATTILEDRANPLESHLTHKPPDQDFNFQYKGNNTSLDQKMICDKISQYLKLKSRFTEYIPKLNKGICAALSSLFLEKNIEEWTNLLNSINEWDGRLDNLSDKSKGNMDIIIEKFKNIYIDKSRIPLDAFFGELLNSFLDKNKGEYILANPWHAIAIKYKNNGVWYVYDPNYKNGYKEIKSDELMKVIQTESLGSLILTQSPDSTLSPIIKDPHAFINDGGLFVLTQASNYQAILHLLPHANKIKSANINGLILRNVDGVPAWVGCFESKNKGVSDYCLNLLSHFSKVHPDQFMEKLIASMDAMKPVDIHRCIESLIDINMKCDELYQLKLISSILAAIHEEALKHSSEKVFEVWQTPKNRFISLDAFLMECCQHPGEKKLIELDSGKSTINFLSSLQQHCIHIKRPFYFINSPDELVCSAPYIERDRRHVATIKKGPGGSLYNFLQTSNDPDNPALIMLNYDNFNADDIVRFNSLLDENRYIDGVGVPGSAIVIGAMNANNPSRYDGADFYSRFDKLISCPFSHHQLEGKLKPLPLLEEIDADDKSYIINLCHASNWEERLLGQWQIQGNHLDYKHGLLIEALRSSEIIEIQNGPWSDDRFEHFWRQAYLNNYIDIAGEKFELPNGFKLIRTDGYDWQRLDNFVKLNEIFQPGLLVLNPSLLNDFFVQYKFDETSKTMRTLMGHIEAHAGGTLSVNITRELDENQLASLILECEKHNVKLNCFYQLSNPLQNKWNQNIEQVTSIIASSDPDTSIALITDKDEPWQIFDVSELQASDLLIHLDARMNDQTLAFEFSQSQRALILALSKNENIILRGWFSPELSDILAKFLLERQNQDNPKGKLVLVPNNADFFNFLAVEYHQVTNDEKKMLLEKRFEKDKVIRVLSEHAEETLSELNARLCYININANQYSQSDLAWNGLHYLDISMKLDDFDGMNSEIIATEFVMQRLNTVNGVLEYSPYVYLTGLTGVGKSSFVEKYLKNQDKTNLYISEENIIEWAMDKSDNQKILFIDEANIGKREWSEFEGLFNRSPGILINGAYYPLTENHKVVFAGNPLSYGDERKLATFFDRHGSAIVFNPMPLAFIYENILKSIFSNSLIEKDTIGISKELLNVYKFICECSTTEILISPRELQMMALLTVSHCEKQPGVNSIDVARYYAQTLAANLVPGNYKPAFEKQFPVIQLAFSAPQLQADLLSEFVITPSREPLIQQLNDLLALRKHRTENRKTLNEAQLYGGLGGIVIEGEPGIGKSELVIAALRAQGYEEAHPNRSKQPVKPFFRIPVSMQTERKKELILKAFHEGAVVIIDEINSSHMMERFLNSLLMGKTPDGTRPNNPGFLLIGTQNPVTMGGRRVPSKALARRLIPAYLPAYPSNELEYILIRRGSKANEAKIMVQSYQKKLSHALQFNLSPRPTFRDLIRFVEGQKIANQKYVRPLVELAKKGDENKFFELLKKNNNNNINLTTRDGVTPLDAALSEGYFDLAMSIIKAGGRIGRPELFLSINDISDNSKVRFRSILDTLDFLMKSMPTDTQGDLRHLLVDVIIDLCEKKADQSYSTAYHDLCYQHSLFSSHRNLGARFITSTQGLFSNNIRETESQKKLREALSTNKVISDSASTISKNKS